MKTVLVTGGARGIGKAISEKFAKNGYNVIVNYSKSEEAAYALAQEYSNVRTFKADISNKKDVKNMIEFAQNEFKGVDILVNNAGISSSGLIQDLSEEELNRIFAVNVNGTFNCTQAVLPQMISRKEGVIINISSMWGQVGSSCEVHYSVSKAGMIGLTKALAKEVGPSNIRVNCICPGVIDTQMNNHLSSEDKQALINDTPLFKIGKCQDIVNAIIFLCEDKSSFITGQIFGVNGGYII